MAERNSPFRSDPLCGSLIMTVAFQSSQHRPLANHDGQINIAYNHILIMIHQYATSLKHEVGYSIHTLFENEEALFGAVCTSLSMFFTAE